MAAYLFEPSPAASPTYDYGNVYSNISTYLNQVREELADIDVDTTASAATLLLIATSLGTMATNSTTMATNSTTMATNSTTIANKLTDIETYQQRLKELGESTGIHIRGPYESIGFISMYRMLIEQAKLIDHTEFASPSERERAMNALHEYIEKIKPLSEF